MQIASSRVSNYFYKINFFSAFAGETERRQNVYKSEFDKLSLFGGQIFSLSSCLPHLKFSIQLKTNSHTIEKKKQKRTKKKKKKKKNSSG